MHVHMVVFSWVFQVVWNSNNDTDYVILFWGGSLKQQVSPGGLHSIKVLLHILYMNTVPLEALQKLHKADLKQTGNSFWK
jgi:hypothetical protein